MASFPKKGNKIGEIKKNVHNFHICPFCKEKIEIGIELEVLNNLDNEELFPYPHIHLHGNPLHAMICYIDKNLTVRNVGMIKSIEISREAATFRQIMKKWANPY